MTNVASLYDVNVIIKPKLRNMLTRHIREFLQVTPGPFPDFWVGPGDEARLGPGGPILALATWTGLENATLTL